MLQKEIDNLEACSDVRADTSEEEDEDHEQEIVALKIVYTRVYKLMNSKHQNCGEFEKLQAVKDDLKLTFNQRKLELDNVTKQFDALIEDPELKAARKF